mmetsp:Transcript_30907/g.73695  ORF Transcript_30907/g.73695 Transcript_30907/m.73695 type:complete len:211 (-) Transcript_30907:681-1313(-)
MQLLGNVVAALVAEGRRQHRPAVGLQPLANDCRSRGGLSGPWRALDQGEALPLIQNHIARILLRLIQVLLPKILALGIVLVCPNVFLARRAADVGFRVGGRSCQGIPLGRGGGRLPDVRVERICKRGARQKQPAEIRIVVQLLDGISRVGGLVHPQTPLQLIQHPVNPLVCHNVWAKVNSEQIVAVPRGRQSLIWRAESDGSITKAFHFG